MSKQQADRDKGKGKQNTPSSVSLEEKKNDKNGKEKAKDGI